MSTDISTNYTGNFDQPQNLLDVYGQRITRYFDCSVLNLTGSTNYVFAKVEDGMVITDVVTVVKTAEGAAATLDIGDSGSATRFETDANLNTIGVTKSSDAQKHYTTATDLWITPSATLDTAQFWVIVKYERVSTSQIGTAVT